LSEFLGWPLQKVGDVGLPPGQYSPLNTVSVHVLQQLSVVGSVVGHDDVVKKYPALHAVIVQVPCCQVDTFVEFGQVLQMAYSVI
jgi:hypothetical protein